jgi:hypothetical protein
MIAHWFQGFGALRLMLIGLSATLMLLGPVSGGEVSFEGIALFTTLLAPTFYVVMIFVLPLDMTMSRVFMSDATPVKRTQLRRVIITEAVLLLLMLLAWLPFVLKLLRIT